MERSHLFYHTWCGLAVLQVILSSCKIVSADWNSTAYRVLFEGGYHDNSEGSCGDDMCFTYKLHQHVNFAKSREENETVVYSIDFCDLANSNGHVLSDFLKSVTMVKSGEGDEYYVDDSTFHYLSTDESVDPIVDLCFQQLSDSQDVKMVTETNYCINHMYNHDENNVSTSCFTRGVYVTDVCGLPSIGRFNVDESPASIAYVPEPGQIVNLRDHSRRKQHYANSEPIVSGRGTYQLVDDLVVVRGWWIDACGFKETYDGDVLVEITMIDDYLFRYIDSELNFDDLVGRPLTMPIYDHFIVPSECENIHGMISSYKYNPMNEEIVLTIDSRGESALMFFKDASFDIKRMTFISSSTHDINYNEVDRLTFSNKTVVNMADTEEDEEEEEHYEDSGAVVPQDERRRLFFKRIKRAFKKLVSKVRVPKSITVSKRVEFRLPTKEKSITISFRGKEFGTCDAELSPYLFVEVGLGAKIKTGFLGVPTGLREIFGYIELGVGADASANCEFFPDDVGEDGIIEAELFARRFSKAQMKVTIGPIVITVLPFLDISLAITRPALNVRINAVGHYEDSIKFKTGWRSGTGFFTEFTGPSLDPQFEIVESEYPGKDGRLTLDLGFFVKPGIEFGLYTIGIVTTQLVAQLPYMSTSIGLDGETNAGCSDSQIGISFDAEFGLSLTAQLVIHEIRILKIKIFGGRTFEPKDPLLDIKLFDFDVSLGCIGDDDINPTQLFGSAVQNVDPYLEGEVPFVLLKPDSPLSWEEANAYCQIIYGTNLATIEGDAELDDVRRMAGNDGTSFAWIGLNDKDDDGIYNWADANETVNDESVVDNPNNLCAAVRSTNVGSTVGSTGCTAATTNVPNFLCDLEDFEVKNIKYVAVFGYDFRNDDGVASFDEANDFCDKKFGTELATIVSSDDNDMVLAALQELTAEETGIVEPVAWIGINGIRSEYDFDWADERQFDSPDQFEVFWADGDPNNLDIGETCVVFSTSAGTWQTKTCDGQTGPGTRTFVCNRPNGFIEYEHYNYVGIETSEYGLTWEEANTFCGDEFGTGLATIFSENDQEEINKITTKFEYKDKDYDNIWIGLYVTQDDESGEDILSWGDTRFGVSELADSDYTYWIDETEPTLTSGECTYLASDNDNVWNMRNCSFRSQQFICNRPMTEYSNGNYISITSHHEDHVFTYKQANLYCEEKYKTELAGITLESEYNEIITLMDEIMLVDDAWIGFSYNVISEDWDWQDGLSQSANTASFRMYGYWANEDQSQSNNNEYLTNNTCAEFRSDGTWIDRDCDNGLTSFICNKPDSSYDYDNFIGVYTKRESSVYTFETANDYCLDTYGTTLATIYNVDDLTDAGDILKWFNYGYAWIGLNDIDEEGEFTWISNTSRKQYPMYWGPDQPDDKTFDTDSGSTSADCVVLTKQLQYEDIDCNEGFVRSFVCNKPFDDFEQGPFVGVDSGIFVYTWQEAEDYCALNYGTNLASIHSELEQVEGQYIMRDELKVSNYWIGLYKNDGVEMKFSDGTDFDFTPDAVSPPISEIEKVDDCFGTFVSQEGGYTWISDSCASTKFLIEEVTGFGATIGGFLCGRPVLTEYSSDFVATNMFRNDSFTYDEANEYCMDKFDSNLATLIDFYNNNTYDENLYNDTKELFEEVSLFEFGWIGIRYDVEDGRFEWQQSGELSDIEVPLSNIYWYDNNITDADGEETKLCVAVDKNNEYKWVVLDCDTELSAYMCDNNFHTIPYGDYVGVYTKHFNGVSRNFSSANDYCESAFDTELASIHSDEDFEQALHIYNEIADNYGEEDVLFGFRKNFGNQDNWFEWVDGTGNAEDYSKFFNENAPTNEEECMAMTSAVLSNNIGKWDSVACAGNYYAFLCNEADE